mmetsp:Transcript_175134/g.561665  ORF Transcript_175134/g.561665 Transcript_175134/m.561665 type:complete len:360 (-) Transcript_175134:105-1184(-)|eukprot:CAMPEP_0203934042 /NCGR_PEP_ID=MMETSP0359-20131031/72094_1 /ASSEMBLY_ACC=CAM_ASM_000338 /TAXON_ID=268821 /ORGANISM="Scrippsiella Hangoei, Strain SHTV-5" /LENGTH=359 /DNA_ID=CAMNT_0050863703 /DNA_START=69 /DNA_END=1148 /DNA_ORIENTATION=-
MSPPGNGAGRGAVGGEPYLTPGERQETQKALDECEEDTEDARRGGDEKDRQQLLICLERGLHLRRKLYAENSPQVSTACRALCEACNFAATHMLNTENLKGAHDLLKRAEQVADRNDVDRAITWNNLACYYRRMGKLRTAVTFLERALAIEEHLDSADAAQTHLNLCATLSQLQRRSEAINHAQSALIRIYETLSPHMLNGELSGGGEISREHREQITVLCIAYHNLAVEYEYLKNFDAALCNYASGLRWAGRFMDESHQIIGILKNSAEAVKAKLPNGSSALRRAEDLMAGFPERRGSSAGGAGGAPDSSRSGSGDAAEGLGGGESGSMPMDHLMTPRDGRRHEPGGEDSEGEPGAEN